MGGRADTRAMRLKAPPAVSSFGEDCIIVLIVGTTSPCFEGGLVFEAHRWLYQSTQRSRVIKKKRSFEGVAWLRKWFA